MEALCAQVVLNPKSDIKCLPPKPRPPQIFHVRGADSHSKRDTLCTKETSGFGLGLGLSGFFVAGVTVGMRRRVEAGWKESLHRPKITDSLSAVQTDEESIIMRNRGSDGDNFEERGASVGGGEEQEIQPVYVTGSPFSPRVEAAVENLRGAFSEVDKLVAANMRRVLSAFANARVGRHHFSGTTGYGHSDAGGREALDGIFAEISGAEAACVRSQFFSGTHAIASALFAVLRPGDELLSVVGAPYDTLEEVIGTRASSASLNHGSLRDFGVSYRQIDLDEGGNVDWAALSGGVEKKTKVVLVQRSCGYSLRRSLSVAEIGRVVSIVKAQNPECIVVVDNCYGEFLETSEPASVGADLMAGSLIKNPGGTIAPCGGYVAGRKDLVDAAAARLSAPGIGPESGATSGEIMRLFFQGMFLGPQMVGEAIKSSLLIAEVMSDGGFITHPPPRVRRHDIIQAVELGSKHRQLAFCAAVQKTCPVGSYIRPTGGATAGYESEVVFADGTFIDGSTSELSCDGPLRKPFAVFCQGGTHWTHWAAVLDEVIDSLKELEEE